MKDCMEVRLLLVMRLFFFFQAEDGIRDDLVTGVQTCALPICDVAALVRCKLTGHDFIVKEPLQATDESCYITDGKKQASFSVRNGIYNAGCSGGHHWFPRGISLQNNIWKALTVTWQNQDIHQRIISSRIIDPSSENYARMRL